MPEVRERLQVIRTAAAGMPLLITEFGSSYKTGLQNATTATCHDNHEAASYLARAFDETTRPGNPFNLSVLSYWALSDVMEEEGFPAANASFSGSFGLLNPFGVPKPGYRLMQLLNDMGPTRLPVNFSAAASADTCSETVGALAGRNATHALMVLYNQAQRTAPIRGCSVRLNLQRAGAKLEGKVTLWRIDEAHTNPKARWEEIGAPQWPTAAQNAEVMEASIMVPADVELRSVAGAGISIPPQGVAAVAVALV